MTLLKELVNDFISEHKTCFVTVYERDWNNESVKKLEHWHFPIECFMDIVIVPAPIPKWLVRFIVKMERMPKLLSFVPFYLV